MKINFKVALASGALLICMIPFPALAKEPKWFKEQKEVAVFFCLRMNYQALGVDIAEHDFSGFHPRYMEITQRRRSPEYSDKYFDFLEKTVGNFYREEISVKAEVRQPPFTTIFAKCMEFSESKALRDFIIRNPL